MSTIYKSTKKETKEELERKHIRELAAIAAKQLADAEKLLRFDPTKKGSRPTESQQIVIDAFCSYDYENIYVRGGNQSGKTQTCAYLIAHILMETLPNWKRRSKWGNEPLQIIWAVRNSKHIEGSLWRKCKPFLTPGTFKEERQGGILQRVTMDNGNELIFLIYTNLNEATDAAQSYSGHYAFVDELPGKAKLIEELQNRVLIKSGMFVMAFTPKKPAPEVRRIIENADPRFSTGFILKALDNPALDERGKQLQIAKAKQYGAMGAAILEGAWIASDSQVFYLDEKKIIRELPYHYSKQNWVHWSLEDPAIGSGYGLVIIASDPMSDDWYVVRTLELKGAEIECPSTAVSSVLKYTADYNITKRIADPAALYHIREAYHMGVKYSQGPNKLANDIWYYIDAVQEAIGRRVFLTPAAQPLLDQLAEYSTAPEDPDRIVHRKKFHLIDAFRYGVIMLPKPKNPIEVPSDEPVDAQKFLENMVFSSKEKKTAKPKFTERLRVINRAFWGKR